MDDLKYGTRNRRGDWSPNKVISYPPVFEWPFQVGRFLKWLLGFPGYLWPYNALYLGVAFLTLLYATPALETMRDFEMGWVSFIFARNVLLTLVVFGGMHFYLYMRRAQGVSFKYNGKWPSEGAQGFLFRNQNLDNVIWTFAAGVPIWTAFECVTWWGMSNGWFPSIDFQERPIYSVLLILLIPVIRDTHFYIIHRLIHFPPLYRHVHRIHHLNVNPGPWSGLAMHPVEHLLYFSVIAVHWVIPSSPLHLMFNVVHTALAPARGHAGFDKILVGDETAIDTDGYDHYLHHKYFEVNYAFGVIPLDKWFGTFHDGTEESQRAMEARFKARAKLSGEKVARH